MSEEQKHIDMPKAMHVSCPLSQHHLVPAARCDACANFRGLVQMLGNDKLPFERVYSVQCAFPIPRQLHHVEVDSQ